MEKMQKTIHVQLTDEQLQKLSEINEFYGVNTTAGIIRLCITKIHRQVTGED